MRQLSENEKKFTSKLVDLSQRSSDVLFSNIIYAEMSNTNISIDYSNEHVEFHFDKQLYDTNPSIFLDFVRSWSWEVVRYIKLLEYLEKMDLLFLLQESSDEESIEFGTLIVGNQFIRKSIHDKSLIKLILKYSSKTIIINDSLIEYVKNNFKTKDDLHYENNTQLSNRALRIAKYTLIATAVIFVISTAINIWLSFMKC
ncbi:hypothetical protein [Chryseobacterium sp.]|uniref:hypothetical protein n=1 Tax=Chryseobacterium sp. TaxID=1871047 RepID=UPI00289BCB1E|nr:hypothetical protein [Chryseobacterium sp.]